jgi:hypothetical protein
MAKEEFHATCRKCGRKFTSYLSKEDAVVVVDIHMKTDHTDTLPPGGVERRGR